MRLFGGERVQTLMNTLGVEEDMPIENKMITGVIENAQKKLEARNFAIRKSVLQFDDVMNAQREIIYGVIKELLRNYLWQRRQQQRSKIIQSRAGSQP